MSKNSGDQKGVAPQSANQEKTDFSDADDQPQSSAETVVQTAQSRFFLKPIKIKIDEQEVEIFLKNSAYDPAFLMADFSFKPRGQKEIRCCFSFAAADEHYLSAPKEYLQKMALVELEAIEKIAQGDKKETAPAQMAIAKTQPESKSVKLASRDTSTSPTRTADRDIARVRYGVTEQVDNKDGPMSKLEEAAQVKIHKASPKKIMRTPVADRKDPLRSRRRAGLKLINAIIRADEAEIERLLQSDIDLTVSYEADRRTPLLTACFYNNKKLVSTLLSRGADPNVIT